MKKRDTITNFETKNVVKSRFWLTNYDKHLNYYISRYKPVYSIRLSTKNFGETGGIKLIPLYASFLI